MTALALSLTRATRSMDRVALTILAILAVLALLVPPQALASLRFTAASLLEVAPFLLLSVGVAVYAKASGADNLITRAFTGRLAVMIVLAALMGALSPLCSCGVIPLIAALLAMGVPLPPVMAFWLASPIMDRPCSCSPPARSAWPSPCSRPQLRSGSVCSAGSSIEGTKRWRQTTSSRTQGLLLAEAV
jgi:hypothetical protein